jgi:hypothetical protein
MEEDGYIMRRRVAIAALYAATGRLSENVIFEGRVECGAVG